VDQHLQFHISLLLVAAAAAARWEQRAPSKAVVVEAAQEGTSPTLELFGMQPTIR
jgi:hypothetical protein